MTDALRFDRFEVRLAGRRLLVDGEPAALGVRAFDLLLALIERRDRVVRKTELFDIVWGGVPVEENNMSVQISALRKRPDTLTKCGRTSGKSPASRTSTFRALPDARS